MAISYVLDQFGDVIQESSEGGFILAQDSDPFCPGDDDGDSFQIVRAAT